MTNKQKLELRLSSIRQRLNTIGGLEGAEFTDEIRSESETLQTEFADAEVKFRSAVIAEGENNGGGELRRVDSEDSESAEIRQLSDKVELRHYLDTAACGGNLTGPESELNAALHLRSAGVSVPWQAIAPRRRVERVEARADAATALPRLRAADNRKGLYRRVFDGGASEFLGIRFDSVPVGEASHFVLTAGVTPAHKAAGADEDASAATIVGKVLEPHRLTAAYSFRVEDLARSQHLEEALRQDLAGALREGMDSAVLNGATDGPAGILSTLTAPSDPTVEIDYAGIIKEASSGVDGRFAKNLLQVRLLLGAQSYRKIASSFSTDGAPKRIGLFDPEIRRFGRVRAHSSLFQRYSKGIAGANGDSWKWGRGGLGRGFAHRQGRVHTGESRRGPTTGDCALGLCDFTI